MPHRISTHGSYRIDRQFPGVGRIAIASGATTVAGFKARNNLLTRLHDKGRLDVLRAIKAGEITLTQAYAADRENRLDTLVGLGKALSAGLWTTVDAWVPGSAKAAPTQRRYELSFKQLKERWPLANKHVATVATLAEVDWIGLERTWPGGGSDWNHLRRAVSKFLTDTLGDVHHPMRREIMKQFPKRPERKRVPDLSVGLFWRIVQKAPEHVRPAFVTLAATGMRTGEYLRLTKAHLKPNTLSIEVPGTKTEGSAARIRVAEQLWPWIEAAVPAPVQYKWLRLYWKQALAAAEADTSLRLHDLRHACAQWLIDAGRPEASVQRTLRHANATMTRRYAEQRDRGEDARAMAGILVPLSVPRSENQGENVRSA